MDPKCKTGNHESMSNGRFYIPPIIIQNCRLQFKQINRPRHVYTAFNGFNVIFYIQTLNFVQSQVDPILSALNRQFETRPDPNYKLDCYHPLRDLFTKYEKVIKPEYSFVRNFGKSSNQSKVEEVKEMILDPQRSSFTG